MYSFVYVLIRLTKEYFFWPPFMHSVYCIGMCVRSLSLVSLHLEPRDIHDS